MVPERLQIEKGMVAYVKVHPWFVIGRIYVMITLLGKVSLQVFDLVFYFFFYICFI